MNFLSYLTKNLKLLKLKPLDIWYRFLFEDGFKFDYSGDEDSMISQIEKINKQDVKGYNQLVIYKKF